MTPVVTRPYQDGGRHALRVAFGQGHRRVLAVAPTGAGKTVMFSAIAASHVERGGRVLVVVHRRELIAQTVKTMLAAGVERAGIVAAGWPEDPTAAVQVASIQTLLARDALPDASLVILDEAHHYVADEWGQIAARYRDSYLLGFTATPERVAGHTNPEESETTAGRRVSTARGRLSVTRPGPACGSCRA